MCMCVGLHMCAYMYLCVHECSCVRVSQECLHDGVGPLCLTFIITECWWTVLMKLTPLSSLSSLSKRKRMDKGCIKKFSQDSSFFPTLTTPWTSNTLTLKCILWTLYHRVNTFWSMSKVTQITLSELKPSILSKLVFVTGLTYNLFIHN